ncbi:MAG TPA: M23 family metallopeptidase [Vicinamibacteria bacterium]|nr:M23 family metallopeptidase [Vicinamibacteria bacterium]
MANEFYTLIVVPHAKARFRKFQVSVRVSRWLVSGASVSFLVLGGLALDYARIATEVRQLRQLRAQNAALLTKNREYEAGTQALQGRVETLQGIVTKLGVMAGLEHTLPDPQVGGVGGVTGPEAVAPSSDRPVSLQSVDRSVADLTEKSRELERFYKDQSVLLASTPSIWPVRGYLSATFGNRLDPFTGAPDFHPGIDISAPTGTRIIAPADGIVLSAGERGGYGNAIVLDHTYGVVTRYGHLSGFAVKPGQRVKRGDVLGYVGQTGRSTAPHCHYEVWVRDQAQNPIHFILDEYRTFG